MPIRVSFSKHFVMGTTNAVNSLVYLRTFTDRNCCVPSKNLRMSVC